MKKFTFAYLAVLILFIFVGAFFILFGSKEETPEIDEAQINKTPGLQVMLDLSSILTEQQLEESMINIEVVPMAEQSSAVIELQGNTLVTEDVLNKDMHHLFVRAGSLQDVEELTVLWYSDIVPNNGEVLKVTMTKEQMLQLQSQSYTMIPQLAATYEKHANLQ